MAIEYRNSNMYYYRKRRVGNRVISEYIGKGESALLFANLDRIEREEQRMKARILRENMKKLEIIDQDLSEIEEMTRTLIETYLVSKGFYKTKSREWRLKRNGNCK